MEGPAFRQMLPCDSGMICQHHLCHIEVEIFAPADSKTPICRFSPGKKSTRQGRRTGLAPLLR